MDDIGSRGRGNVCGVPVSTSFTGVSFINERRDIEITQHEGVGRHM